MGIHPDLEEPIQEFYQAKRKQREEIYQRFVKDISKKESSALTNPEDFLKEHTALAEVISKPALDQFTLRIKRFKDRFEINKLPKDKPTGNAQTPDPSQQQTPPSQQKSTGTARMVSPKNQKFTPSETKPNFSTPKNSSSVRNLQMPTALEIYFQISIEPEERCQGNETERSLKDNSITRSLSQRLMTPQNNSEYAIKKNDFKIRSQQRDAIKRKKRKTIRSIERLKSELDDTTRQSTELTAQINYLSGKEDPQLPDNTQVSNFKLCFAEGIVDPVTEYFRRKRIRDDIPALKEKAKTYHKTSRPPSGLFQRIQPKASQDLTTQTKAYMENVFLTNGNQTESHRIIKAGIPQPENYIKHRTLTESTDLRKLTSPPNSRKSHVRNCTTQISANSVVQDFSGAAKESLELTGLFTPRGAQEVVFSTPRQLNSQIRKSVHVISRQEDATTVEKPSTNNIYATLFLKSAQNKKIFRKRNYSGQVLRSTSKDFCLKPEMKNC